MDRQYRRVEGARERCKFKSNLSLACDVIGAPLGLRLDNAVDDLYSTYEQTLSRDRVKEIFVETIVQMRAEAAAAPQAAAQAAAPQDEAAQDEAAQAADAAAEQAPEQGDPVIYMGQVQHYAEWYAEEGAIPEEYRDRFDRCAICGRFWDRDALEINSAGDHCCPECGSPR